MSLTREDWPSAIRWSLIESAERAGSVLDPSRRARLVAVLDGRRGPAKVLDALDREARRVRAGDRSAASTIRALLDPIAARAPRPVWRTRRGAARVRRILTRMRGDPAAFLRLPPDGVVDPVAMLFVVDAVMRVAGASAARRARYARAVDSLWTEAARLDPIVHAALDSSDHAGERFDAVLEAHASLASMPQLAPAGRPDIPSHPVYQVLHGFVVGLGAVPVNFGPLGSLPVDVTANPITSISPNPACGGEILTIRGSGFGATQPPEIDVVLDAAGLMLGGIVLEVVSWSNTVITVRIPEGTGSGCIGMRNRKLAARGVEVWQQRTELFGVLNLIREMQGLPSFPVPLVEETGGFLPTPIPCTGRNHFLGTLPEVEKFESNATPLMAGKPPVIQPGVALVLTWQVANAESVTITRVGTVGPSMSEDVASAGSRNLGKFFENSLVTATYRLKAQNRCGTAIRVLHVTLRPMPALKVRGIEVAQTVQRFDVLGPGERNTVRLAGRRRTVARVYLESGLSGNFDFGTPGFTDALQVNYAELQLTTSAGVSMAYPENPGMRAQPLSSLAGNPRAFWNSLVSESAKSLNFLLPWENLDGQVQLKVTVETGDGGPGTKAVGVTDVLFETRRHFHVLFVPIVDTAVNLPPPTTAEFVSMWRAALAVLPLTEHHWLTYSYAPPWSDDYDLSDSDGWQDMVDDMVDLYDGMDFNESQHLLIALVRNHPNHAIAGKGPTGRGVNVATARLPDATSGPSTLAHEVTHAFGISHSACGGENSDPSLPCKTEDVGVDLELNSVIDAGVNDLMTTPSGNMTSIVQWNRLIQVLPGG